MRIVELLEFTDISKHGKLEGDKRRILHFNPSGRGQTVVLTSVSQVT
jgi:hypothetical protein